MKDLEDVSDTCVVGKHHATYFMLGRDVGTLLSQGHLDRSRSPRDEVSQVALTDALKRFMHFIGVYLTLDNIQNRNVASLLGASVH